MFKVTVYVAVVLSVFEVTLPLVKGAVLEHRVVRSGEKRMITGMPLYADELSIAKALASKIYNAIFDNLSKGDKDNAKLSLSFLYLHPKTAGDEWDFSNAVVKAMFSPCGAATASSIKSLTNQKFLIWPKLDQGPSNLRVVSAKTRRKVTNSVPEDEILAQLKDITTPLECPKFVILGKQRPCNERAGCIESFLGEKKALNQAMLCPTTMFYFYVHNRPLWQVVEDTLSAGEITTIFPE